MCIHQSFSCAYTCRVNYSSVLSAEARDFVFAITWFFDTTHTSSFGNLSLMCLDFVQLFLLHPLPAHADFVAIFVRILIILAKLNKKSDRK